MITWCVNVGVDSIRLEKCFAKIIIERHIPEEVPIARQIGFEGLVETRFQGNQTFRMHQGQCAGEVLAIVSVQKQVIGCCVDIEG